MSGMRAPSADALGAPLRSRTHNQARFEKCRGGSSSTLPKSSAAPLGDRHLKYRKEMHRRDRRMSSTKRVPHGKRSRGLLQSIPPRGGWNCIAGIEGCRPPSEFRSKPAKRAQRGLSERLGDILLSHRSQPLARTGSGPADCFKASLPAGDGIASQG